MAILNSRAETRQMDMFQVQRNIATQGDTSYALGKEVSFGGGDYGGAGGAGWFATSRGRQAGSGAPRWGRSLVF